MVNVTTVARVKALDASFKDSADDARLAAIIEGVSATAEQVMCRALEKCRRVQTLNVTRFQNVFRLHATPVDRLISIKNDGQSMDLQYVSLGNNGTIRVHSPFSFLNSEHRFSGSINRGELYYGPGMLVVEYLGGMASDTEDFIAKYRDIAFEADKQVLFEFRRMKNITEKSVSAGGATTSMVEFNILPSFKAALLRRKPKVFFA